MSQSRMSPVISTVQTGHLPLGVAKGIPQLQRRCLARRGPRVAQVAPENIPTATLDAAGTAPSTSARLEAGVNNYASISRVILTGQPSSIISNIPNAGPISVLVLMMGIFAAAMAAIRGMLVSKVKGCQTCRGYGVERCRLCSGSGNLDWQAKFGHLKVCPLCFNKRYVKCTTCGGYHNRPIFIHVTQRDGAAYASVSEYPSAKLGFANND